MQHNRGSGEPASIIRALLPPQIAVAERFDHLATIDLYPEESQVIASAVAKRRYEFISGRACARSALEQIGARTGALVPGANGAPHWPTGVVGSITHCQGYCASVAAWSSIFAGIGIDAEPDQPLPPGVIEATSNPAERRSLATLENDNPNISWSRLLFSAKESVFKASSSTTLFRRGIDFGCIDVEISHNGTFRATVSSSTPATCRFFGRWSCGSGILVTTVVVYNGSKVPLNSVPGSAESTDPVNRQ